MKTVNRITLLGLTSLFAAVLLSVLLYTTALGQSQLVINAPPEVEARSAQLITITIDYEIDQLLDPPPTLDKETRLYYQFESVNDGVMFSNSAILNTYPVSDESNNTMETIRYWVIESTEQTGTFTISLQMVDQIVTDTLQHNAFLSNTPISLTVMPTMTIPFTTAEVVETSIIRIETLEIGQPKEPQKFIIKSLTSPTVDPGEAAFSFQIEEPPTSEWDSETRLKLRHSKNITPTIDKLENAMNVGDGTEWSFPQGTLTFPLRLEFNSVVSQQELADMLLEVVSPEGTPYEGGYRFNDVAMQLHGEGVLTIIPPQQPEIETTIETTTVPSPTVIPTNTPISTSVPISTTTFAIRSVSLEVGDVVTEGEAIELAIDYRYVEGEWPEDGIRAILAHENLTVVAPDADAPEAEGEKVWSLDAENDEIEPVILQLTDVTTETLAGLQLSFVDANGDALVDTNGDELENEGLSNADRTKIMQATEGGGFLDGPLLWIGLIVVALLGLLGMLLLLLRGRSKPQTAGASVSNNQVPPPAPVHTGQMGGGGPITGNIVTPPPPRRPQTNPAFDTAYLLLQSDNRPFKIGADGLTIGRGDSNGVMIDTSFPGWESVSRDHARIMRQDAGYVVEDLGSRNGVFVQGRPTAKNLLKDGWTVSIGGVQFTFHNPGGN